jgi:tetratricopeptide (TPR) repeat protein
VLGEADKALCYYEACRDSWRAANDPRGVATALCEIAILHMTTLQFAEAEYLLSEAAEMAEKANAPSLLGRTYSDRGLCAILSGDFASALGFLSEAIMRFRTLGWETPHLPSALFYLGVAQALAGRLGEALASLREASESLNRSGSSYILSYTMLGYALVANRLGAFEQAATLCGATTRLMQLHSIKPNPAVRAIYEHETSLTKNALGDEQWNRLFASGLDMTLDEALRLAYSLKPKDGGSG